MMRMEETRTEKWRKYREKIKNLPDSKFPPHNSKNERSASPEDQESVMNATSASSLSIGSKKPTKNVVYGAYLQKRRTKRIIKYSVAVILLVLFVVAYFVFVKGA